MEKQKHIEYHKQLHKCLDELAGDFFAQTGKMPSKSSVMDLMEWSCKQTENPTGEWVKEEAKKTSFSCLSHGRAELDCKDCREEAISELIRLSKGVKGTKTRQALRLAIEAIGPT